MDYSIALLFLSLMVSVCRWTEGADASQEEAGQALLDSMLKNYDKRVPPRGNGGKDSPVVVKSTMYVLDVQKISDYHENFQAQFYFRQSWNDSRLRFDGRGSPVQAIYVKDPEQLWKPDIFFSQETDGKLHDVLVPNVFMRLKPHGGILYSARVTATFRCKMDLRKFPFDTQKCKIAAESYAYTTKSMDLTWDYDLHFKPLSYSEDIDLREYALKNITPSVETVDMNGNEYRCLSVLFTIERKSDFYALRLYIPLFLLTALSWLTFWIPPKNKGLRATLLLTVLYLMVQIGGSVDIHYSTATAYTKGSDVWIGVCEALVFGSLLEFVLVSVLAKSEKTREKTRDASGTEIEGIDLESKNKETDANTDSLKSSAKFVARNLCRQNQLSRRVDFISKFAFPVLFLFFNIVYWSVYCR